MTKTYQDHQAKALSGLYKKATSCRLCKGKNLSIYLDLGLTPPADQFRKPEELDLPEISYPLRVMLCRDCGFSQLTHVVDPRVLYQFDYPYESSTTSTGRKHWAKFAEMVNEKLGLKKGDLVVDVGSNVGTLLSAFKDLGMSVHGVDPAPNIALMANKLGVPTICDFFGISAARQIVKKRGKASVVVGTNVFAHIDDLHAVMRAAKVLLKPDGVFIFESPYFKHLVDNLEYDTVYHEHLSYISLSPLVPFFAKHGMEIFSVEESDIHGGSIRVYVGKSGKRKVEPRVKELISAEKSQKLNDLKSLQVFAEKVKENRRDLTALVASLLKQGKSIAVVSAPAKGMTLLNYCNFTNHHLDFVSEKSKLKIGRVTPGGHIKIVSDEELLKRQPDYVILLAWNFAKEIMANLKRYSDKGGKFIIPIPKPTII